MISPPKNGSLLVAVDVDGTLLNTEFEDVLGSREIAAMDAVRAAGHVLALCTGRNLNSVALHMKTDLVDLGMAHSACL